MSESRSLRAIAACRLFPNCTSTSVPMVKEERSEVGSPEGFKDSRPEQNISEHFMPCSINGPLEAEKTHMKEVSYVKRRMEGGILSFRVQRFRGPTVDTFSRMTPSPLSSGMDL